MPVVSPEVAPVPAPPGPVVVDPATPGAPVALPGLPGVAPPPLLPGQVPLPAPGLPGATDLRQEVLDRPPPTGESLEAFMDRENLDRIIMVAAIVALGAAALIVKKIQRRRAGG